ncbi:hypothetical protein EDEG_03526 [Edhazardia aedis USNM 41457]|uniref:Uncharacterized protein n=1 Tax=Edhazardia aedis (strain USNM 41457) TaxID=1003232 RepID=J9D384_EDHAE|nr:hypothetical protein EDEG_03526 [Edhazardia aedis USNM 41457]|eukprot:EJW02029.1 hypothetical protein EDEG_03526 [Edhazardia aedis USNM 41457]
MIFDFLDTMFSKKQTQIKQLIEKKEYQTAYKEILLEYKKSPTNIKILCLKGLTESKMGNLKLAVKTLENVIQKNTSDPLPHKYLAQVYKENHLYKNAIRHYSKIIENGVFDREVELKYIAYNLYFYKSDVKCSEIIDRMIQKQLIYIKSVMSHIHKSKHTEFLSPVNIYLTLTETQNILKNGGIFTLKLDPKERFLQNKYLLSLIQHNMINMFIKESQIFFNQNDAKSTIHYMIESQRIELIYEICKVLLENGFCALAYKISNVLFKMFFEAVCAELECLEYLISHEKFLNTNVIMKCTVQYTTLCKKIKSDIDLICSKHPGIKLEDNRCDCVELDPQHLDLIHFYMKTNYVELFNFLY